jgi:hypothetical protein
MERAVPVLPGDAIGVAKDFYVDGPGFQVSFEVIDPFGNTIFVMGPPT